MCLQSLPNDCVLFHINKLSDVFPAFQCGASDTCNGKLILGDRQAGFIYDVFQYSLVTLRSEIFSMWMMRHPFVVCRVLLGEVRKDCYEMLYMLA